MSRTHARRTATLAVVALAAAVLISALALTACGGDQYTGTWKAEFMGEEMVLKIEKDGDSYTVSPEGESGGETVTATEEDGKLLIQDPDEPSQQMTLERQDDKLVMSLGGMDIEFTKE
jgi:uncharacterized lipoprotein YehR (DUF1307 family)